MAQRRGAAARNRPPEQPVEPLAHDAFLPDRAQQLCLDAGRALALFGGVLVAVPPAFYRADDDTALLAAFVGFTLWTVGAWLCLLALTPAAPRAVRAAAAAASTVLIWCLSPLMNY